MKRWSSLVVALMMAAGITACDKAKEISGIPVPTASDTIIIPGSPSSPPERESAKTTLFTDIQSTDPPTKMNLTIDGKEYSSPFMRIELQPFGFFVPGLFKVFTFEDGSRIGWNDAEFIDLSAENNLQDKLFQEADLAKYKEYVGSSLDGNGVRHDAFFVQGADAPDTFVTFRYFEKNKEKVLPGFVEVAEHLRFLKPNPAENKAEEDLQQFLYLVKKKEHKGLLALLRDAEFYSFLKSGDTAKMIEGFEKNFDLPSLRATLHYSGSSMNPGIGQFEYVFYDRKHPYPQADDSKMDDTFLLTLRYDEKDKPVFHTPYVRYFPFAQKMVDRYISLIKQGKVRELAAFLNPDDAEVPDQAAKKTIKRYHENFDLSRVTVRYDQGFTFQIVQKNKESHNVKINYGDGLMGISDDFHSKFK